MSGGNIAYLVLVIGAMAVFAFTLAWVTRKTNKQRD